VTEGVSRDCPILGVPPIILGKAADFKFGRYIYGVHPNKHPLKIFQIRDRGRIQGLPNFGGTPYYLRNGKSHRLQIRQIHLQGPSEQKIMKIFGEK